MDGITIFETLTKYGIWALLVVAAITMLAGVSYAVYKKVLHGTKSFPMKKAVVLILLAAWFLLVLFLTTFSRGANYTGKFNISLFSGYINAWNEWSFSEYQLIIFNILMFSPLGFLLPFWGNKTKKLSAASLISFLVTLFIEVLQLLTGQGIFELDDLLHNFVGSMFGYFVSTFILNCIEKKRVNMKYLFRMLALPLFYGVLTLVAVVVYQSQPYGNLPFIPAEKQDMSLVTVKKSDSISFDAQEVAIFRNLCIDNYDYAKMISGEFAEFIGTEWNDYVRTDGSNRIFVNGEEKLTYSTSVGWWSYTNGNPPASLSEEEVATWREKIEAWLDAVGLLPEEAVFALQYGNVLRWDIDAPDMRVTRTDYTSGIILMSIDENHCISSFFCDIGKNKYVADIHVSSEQAAYRHIENGNFEQYNSFAEGDVLYIEECTLEYAYDTKGFYRPIYRYKGYINNKDNLWEGIVSAE